MSPAPELEAFVAEEFRTNVAAYFQWQLNRFTSDAYWSLRQEGPAYFVRIRDLIDSDLAALGAQAVDATSDSKSPGSEGDFDPHA